MRRLLSNGLTNAKQRKHGDWFESVILYMLAGDSADGKRDVCPWKTAACFLICLVTAGRGLCPSVWAARKWRTLRFLNERKAFLAQLGDELNLLSVRAFRKGMQAVARLNGTSDLRYWRFAGDLMRSRPEIQFYDYSKDLDTYRRWLAGELPPNLHLTYSADETTSDEEIWSLCAQGGTVAVVFDTKKDQPLPESFACVEGYTGLPHHVRVIDGDVDDWRFLDPAGVVVGLRAKGRARTDTSGFVRAA